MFIDSHAHLDGQSFDGDREAVLQRARDAGISAIINVGFDMPSCRSTLALAEAHPEIYAAVGIHPHDAATVKEDDFAQLHQWAAHPKVVAVGEIGLDYYRNLSPRDLQREAFLRQIALARKVAKPIIIHDRDAHGEIMDILRQEFYDVPGGVMHCYSGSAAMAAEIVKMGLYISIAGPVTFANNRKLGEVVEQIELGRLLIETDAPYLTPEPHRGKRNESAFVRFVAEKIAEIKKISVEEVASVTSANTRRLFGLD
ncbi:MAG TPA: TatD family hydrolase [Negativicutes bacterium]|nr:TatD family hydrolase [Negativicutes bacterium]